MARPTQFKIVLLGAAVLADWPVSGKAQSWLYGPAVNRGLYLEFAVGPTFTETVTRQTQQFQTRGPTTPGLAGPFDLNESFSAGYALGGRVGYGFTNGLRLEEEIMYRYNDLDSASAAVPSM